MKEIEILLQGGTILYPTDTIWGLGCDSTNAQAIEKLMALKGRDRSKSLLILVADLIMLGNYVSGIPPVALDLINKTKEPLTIIYPKAKNLPRNLVALNGSIGIRIPNHAYFQKLLNTFGKPIVSTSANVSGMPSPTSFFDIDDEIKNKVDYIVEYDNNITSNDNKPSAIYLLSANGQISKIR